MMKTIGSTLILFVWPLFIFGQIRFSVEVKGLDRDYILVEKPIDGQYVPSPPEKVLRGKKDRFLIEVNDITPGFMNIRFNDDHSLKVFLEPGETNSVKVNISDFQKSAKFAGPHALQNKFLHDLKRQPLHVANYFYINPISGDMMEDLKPKDYYLDVLDNIEAEKKILYRKGKKKFSKEFMKAVATDISFYHICHFSQLIAREYKKQLDGLPSDFSSKWALYWEKIFNLQPFNSTDNFVSDYYAKALDSYIGDFRLGYKGDAMYLDPDTEIGEQFLEYDRLLGEKMKGKSHEYAMAAIYSQRALLGNNEAVLFDLFQKFKNDYPSSQYIPSFQDAVAVIGEEMEEEKFNFPEGINQLDGLGEINTVEEITKMFPGKVVYMDIWATWCSPCLFEFRQKKPLEEFINGKDIVTVYISVDNEDRRDRWQNLVMENNLKGHHILANFSLRDELIKKFGDGSNLALPHYMIYDKKGKLVDGDAKQPSQNVKLFQDLSRYID